MQTLNEITAELSITFKKDEIEWRVGSVNADNTMGFALAYLTSRAVMDRLDTVLGIDGWEDEYEHIIMKDDKDNTVTGIRCTLKIKIENKWITKQDVADLSATEKIKGGYSDALKRAAVKFGVGRYLYSLPKFWVALKPGGKYLAKNPDLPAGFFTV